MVNRYSYSLKGPGSRVDFTPGSLDSLLYYPGEMEGGLYRAFPDDKAGYLTASLFLAIGSNDISQFDF